MWIEKLVKKKTLIFESLFYKLNKVSLFFWFQIKNWFA